MGHRRIVRRSHAAHRVILTEHLFDWTPRELGKMRVSPQLPGFVCKLGWSTAEIRRPEKTVSGLAFFSSFSPHFAKMSAKPKIETKLGAMGFFEAGNRWYKPVWSKMSSVNFL